jgi:hypothetical protein
MAVASCLMATVCLGVLAQQVGTHSRFHGDTPPSKICLSSLALSTLSSQPADRGTHREAADPPRRRGIARCLAQRRVDRTPSRVGRLPVISCHARRHHPAKCATHTHTHCTAAPSPARSISVRTFSHPNLPHGGANNSQQASVMGPWESQLEPPTAGPRRRDQTTLSTAKQVPKL